jgi:hypothetical protein
LFTVRCQTRRTTKGLYRAKCYCVPFVVRPDEKCTAKRLPCVLGPLPCGRGARQSCCFPLCAAEAMYGVCRATIYVGHNRRKRRAGQKHMNTTAQLRHSSSTKKN